MNYFQEIEFDLADERVTHAVVASDVFGGARVEWSKLGKADRAWLFGTLREVVRRWVDRESGRWQISGVRDEAESVDYRIVSVLDDGAHVGARTLPQEGADAIRSDLADVAQHVNGLLIIE